MSGIVDGDVSVVIIVRNGARFLHESLGSVLSGTRLPLEIVVVDGGSTDDSVAIALSFERVLVISQRSTGIAGAYNEGIAASQGSLVAFISHDDKWMPRKLELQAGCMRAEPELGYSVTHVQHVLEDGVTAPPGFRRELLDAPVPGFLMEAMMARRQVFAEVGPFDPAFSVSEDTDWFARAGDAGIPMRVLPETLLIKRVHHANSSLTHPGISSLLLRAVRNSISRKRTHAGNA